MRKRLRNRADWPRFQKSDCDSRAMGIIVNLAILTNSRHSFSLRVGPSLHWEVGIRSRLDPRVQRSFSELARLCESLPWLEGSNLKSVRSVNTSKYAVNHTALFRGSFHFLETPALVQLSWKMPPRKRQPRHGR